jgi:hypothetical protein
VAGVDEHGGINGRNDGYSPPKTLEQIRQLVEQDGVLALFQTLGTPPNSAIREYLNENKVPQLFVATGADKWNDPKHFPWTIGWQPSYRIESRMLKACGDNLTRENIMKQAASLNGLKLPMLRSWPPRATRPPMRQ